MKKIIAISFAMVIGTSALANGNGKGKDACLTQADPKTHSAWRIIDGKKCWYRGYRGRARESLYWEPAPQEGEPLKDRLDHAFREVEANQPQPSTDSVPLPRPKPTPPWWERLWESVLRAMNWLRGGT